MSDRAKDSTSGNVVAFPQSDGNPALIPPGVYSLAYHHHRIVRRFDRDVLEVWFTVADFGEYFQRRLARYYNVKASAKRRSFQARPGSDFVSDYCTVFARRPRLTAAPIDAFKHILVRGRVETVTRNHRQKPLPEAMRYSTVRSLLGRAD